MSLIRPGRVTLPNSPGEGSTGYAPGGGSSLARLVSRTGVRRAMHPPPGELGLARGLGAHVGFTTGC